MSVTPPADQEDCQLFNCPEEGCVKTFRTSQNLHRHLDLGRHHFKLHEESQYDQIRRKWAQHCMRRKVTPAEAATRMRSLRNDAGNRLFDKGEWLTVQQVTSYFLRLAAMKKMSQLPTAVESLEEEGEDVEAVVQQSERYHLRQRIYNTLTL